MSGCTPFDRISNISMLYMHLDRIRFAVQLQHLTEYGRSQSTYLVLRFDQLLNTSEVSVACEEFAASGLC